MLLNLMSYFSSQLKQLSSNEQSCTQPERPNSAYRLLAAPALSRFSRKLESGSALARSSKLNLENPLKTPPSEFLPSRPFLSCTIELLLPPDSKV